MAIFLIEGIQESPDGETLFMREKCFDCHSFKGRGGAIGPELTGVTGRRSRDWIRDQIRHPERHNPDSRMPGYRHLSTKEMHALVSYLDD